MHKYFAWTEGNGYWGGGQLLSSTQLLIMKSYLPTHYQQFESMQSYDEKGQAIECPIYADLDNGKDLNKAQNETATYTQYIQKELNITPDIYFSGKKGFHVIIPYPIKHNQCHKIVKAIIDEIVPPLKSIDTSVYRTKALLRIPSSPSSEKGRYKIRISSQQLFKSSIDNIIEQSFKPTNDIESEFDANKINESLIEEIATKAKTKIRQPSIENQDSDIIYTHCLQSIFENPVDEGFRNRAVFIMAKYLKSTGIPKEEAIETLLAKDHYNDWHKERSVNITAILNSVFRSQTKPHLGCKNGPDAELLKIYCNDNCIFSDNFPNVRFAATNDTKTRKTTI